MASLAAPATAQPGTFETTSIQAAAIQIQVRATSGDGSVVFVYSTLSAPRPTGTLVWSGSALVNLPLPPGNFYSAPIAISRDGQTFFAELSSGWFLWRADTGPVLSSTLGFPTNLGFPLGFSGDGTQFFGTAPAISPFRAWVWSATAGVRYLADLPGGTLGSQAKAMSADGHVVVGMGSTSTDVRAVAWRDDQPPVPIVSPSFWGTPVATSADGSIVVAQLLGTAWRIRDGQPRAMYAARSPSSYLHSVSGMSDDGW
jgi:uncharacterized membrane protein